jgi:MFS family permease
LSEQPVGRDFIASGFLLTLILRLLTSSLLIVIPLFLSKSLSVPDADIGIYILLLWVGNAVGVLASIVVLKRQSLSSLFGFTLLLFALLGFAASASSNLIVTLSDFAAGVGMGMAQPFLAGLMHLDAKRDNPYRGIGLYSVALGIGLVLGPLAPYLLLTVGGFSVVYLGLAAFATAGIGEVLIQISHRALPSLGEVEYSLSFKQWATAFKSKAFSHAISINFLYSLLLPIVLSYGGVYGEKQFGMSPSTALILFTAIFLISTLLRSAAVQFGQNTELSLFASGVFAAASFLAIGMAPSFPVFLIGMLAFSIPHALVLPATNYKALKSVENETVMNASYVFQASSGVAEFVSPAIAAVMISFFGLPSIFLVMTPVALLVLYAVVLPYLRAVPKHPRN